MRKKRISKKEAQKLHAIKRAKERYGVRLNKLDIRQMSNKIKHGKSTFYDRSTLRISKHFVKHKNREYLVAYDTTRNSICSFLPYPKH